MIRTREVQFPNGKKYKVASIPVAEVRAFFEGAKKAADSESSEADSLIYLVDALRNILGKIYPESEVEEAVADLTVFDLNDDEGDFASDLMYALTGNRRKKK